MLALLLYPVIVAVIVVVPTLLVLHRYRDATRRGLTLTVLACLTGPAVPVALQYALPAPDDAPDTSGVGLLVVLLGPIVVLLAAGAAFAAAAALRADEPKPFMLGLPLTIASGVTSGAVLTSWVLVDTVPGPLAAVAAAAPLVIAFWKVAVPIGDAYRASREDAATLDTPTIDA